MAADEATEANAVGDGESAARAAFTTVEETVQRLASPGDGQDQPAERGRTVGRDGTAEDVTAAQDRAADQGTVSSADVLAALTSLRVLQEQFATWEPLLIGAARDRGASWAAIAPTLGLASRQAAERRYLRLNSHASDPDGMTGEQRVQAARDRRAGDRAVTQWARDNAAMLRRLAAQITALDDLDPGTQASADRLLHALGDGDTATLLSPLAEAGAKLEDSHPNLAGQVSDINVTTDRLRTERTARNEQAWP
ncbi:hypothetical protein [Kribbella shirazensis]|uniref:HSP18 transcriptional regulator n=1 Tax=Kribbella shirazensis TaxID=1105143 RepID=A0A7X5VBJ8_9ACTN|nr:hypothetical protein [Kribbella shirazensis]NIK58196.1 hypothetical protein [Kribbella shirazensis]